MPPSTPVTWVFVAGAQAKRISPVRRTVSDVGILVDTARKTDGIFRDESAKGRVVISGAILAVLSALGTGH